MDNRTEILRRLEAARNGIDEAIGLLRDTEPLPDVPLPASPDGLTRPLPSATMSFRFDPEKPIRGDMSLPSIGWSYPNRQKASPMLRAANPHAKHLAYTVITHFTRYEGIEWLKWADRNNVDREEAFFHAAADGLQYSEHWNHSHSRDPHKYRSVYTKTLDGQFRWQDPKKDKVLLRPFEEVWMGQLDSLNGIKANDQHQPGVFQFDHYLHWDKIVNLDAFARNKFYNLNAPHNYLKSRGIPPWDSLSDNQKWMSRIDRKDGGPGDWLLNVSNPHYRRFVIEDRVRYLDEVFREHKPNDRLSGREFDGLYFDDTALDLIALERRGGIREGLSMERYHQDCASLIQEVMEAVRKKFGQDMYLQCNVGNWSWKYLKHFARICPHVYLDRFINPSNLTLNQLEDKANTLQSLENSSNGTATAVIDGPGGVNCETDFRKKLFLAAYWMIVPNTQRYMISMLFNGDKDRSDWQDRHFHPDLRLDIGQPAGPMQRFPDRLIRQFTKGRVEITQFADDPTDLIVNVVQNQDHSLSWENMVE